MIAENPSDYLPYVDFVESYSSNPLPHFALDIFLKPSNYNELLIGAGTYTQSQKTFPNFILSNPLGVSFAHSALAANHSSMGARMERYGLGNMFQVSSERFSGTDGLSAIQELFDADTGSGGNDVGRYGSKSCIMLQIPTRPLQSIGELQHASINSNPYYPALSIGQSFRSPYLQYNDSIVNSYTTGHGGQNRDFVFYDQNYLMNAVLWDSYFFSTITPNSSQSSYEFDSPSSSTSPYASDIPKVVDDFVSGQSSLHNSRIKVLSSNTVSSSIKENLLDFDKSAAHLKVDGCFNINSTSVDAWAAILSGYKNSHIAQYENGSFRTKSPDGNIRLPRTSISGAFDTNSSLEISSDQAWNGILSLSAEEIRNLATEIVNQIRSRSLYKGSSNHPTPFLSLSDFVNRDLSNHFDFSESGVLQSAIDASGINDSKTTFDTEFEATVKNTLSFTGTNRNYYPNQGYTLNSSLAAPTTLTQGDILQAIGAHISPRSDTFRVRAYGEYETPSGEVIKAHCEAIVQRVIEEENGNFDKRSFKITSFKWIPASGI